MKKVIKNTKTAHQKTMTGKVVSIKRAKTIGVEVIRFVMHPLYKKSLKRSKVFAAHNESLSVVVGDKVKIGEVKPISKTKHFIVLEKVIEKV
jgi:small subunit ribosomal protein S17